MLRYLRLSIAVVLALVISTASLSAATDKGADLKKHFNKAISYQKAGKLKEALAEYQAAKKLDPKNVAILNNLGLVYAGLNQLDNAESALKQVIWAQPKNEFAIEQLARVLLANGKKSEALSYARKFLGLKPKDFTARFLFGMVNLDMKNTDAAAEAFRSALHVKSTDRAALYNLAICYMHLQKYGDALETTEKLVKIDPNNGYFHMLAADVAEKIGDKDTATKHYEAASKSKEAGVNALINLSRIYAPTNEAKSNEMLRKVLSIDKDNYVANFNLGKISYKNGKFKEAEPYFAAAAKAMPKDADAAVSLALTQAQAGKKDEALKSAKIALDLDPKSRAALEVAGYVQEVNSKYDDALNTYRKWEVAYPKDPLPNRKMANVYARQDKMDAAIKHFGIALNKDPKSIDTLKDYAKTLVDKGSLPEAYQQYKKAMDLKPNDADLMVQAANTLQWQSKNDEAIELMKKAIAAEPKNAMPHTALANLYVRQQRPDLALEEYNRILEIDSKSASALHGLAMIYDEKKDYEKEIDAYRKLCEVEPNNPGYPGQIPATYEKWGKLDQAVVESKKLVAAKPEDRSYHSMLAYYLEKTEDYDGALAEYAQLAKSEDVFEKTENYARMAAVQEKQKKTDDAIASYKKSLEARADNPTALDGITKLYTEQNKQAELYAYLRSLIEPGKQDLPYKFYFDTMKKAEKGAEAVALLEGLSAKNPDTLQLSFTLARAYAATDQKDKAIDAYKKLLVAKPNDPWVNKELGPIYESLGRNDEAIASYETAAQAFTYDKDAYLKLGALYEKLGKKAEALATYQKYLKTDPAATEFQEKVKNLEPVKPETAKDQAAQPPATEKQQQ